LPELQKGTLQALQQSEQTTREVSGATDCGVRTGLHGQSFLNLSPPTVFPWVC